MLDVLKPHNPTIVDLARQLASLPGVDGVNVNIYEVDRRVENSKVTVEGEDLNYEILAAVIEDAGGDDTFYRQGGGG